MKNHTRFIPYGRHHIDEDDIASVSGTLRSDWLTQGPKIREFEEEFAKYVGARYAVACSNGTAALHLACCSLQLSHGDIVVTSPISFVASINCALYCGATPAFCDITPSTISLSPDALESFILTHKPPKIVIPVHYAGIPCDMEKIAYLAKKYAFHVIEDACHAPGASYSDSLNRNMMIGSAYHSDMCVFSFHPVKSLTTGEGGMITTNDGKLYEQLQRFRSHGITKDKDFFLRQHFLSEPIGDWYYEQQHLGFNYRITDFQCALGIEQLKKLPYFVTRRRKLANLYCSMLNEIRGVSVLKPSPSVNSAWHIFPILLNDPKRRKEIFDKLRQQGIGVNVHYIPIHLQPYFQHHFGFTNDSFPHAEDFYRRTITLPLFPDMTEDDIRFIVQTLKKNIEE